MSPMLDVSAALCNPYTQDRFDVLRRTEVVNGYGESNVSIERFKEIRGVVHPDGPNALSRRPEAQTNAKTMVIFTRFAIRGESKSANQGKGFQPDLIKWRGNMFVVNHVEDWSKFARGFVKVTVTSSNIVDQAPETTGQTTPIDLNKTGYGNDPYGEVTYPGVPGPGGNQDEC